MRIEHLYRASDTVPPRMIMPRIAAVVALGLALSACGTGLPFMTAVGLGDEEATGSVGMPAGSSGLRSGEAAAIRAALDPAAEGAPVAWYDPKTGRRGTVAAAGPAFVSQDRLCRAFTLVVERLAGEERSVGSACRIGAGPWTLGEMKPAPDKA